MVPTEEASIQKTKEKLKAVEVSAIRARSAFFGDTHKSDISSRNFKQI